MPMIQINNANIYYEDSASADNKKPVIVFAHGLLWSTKLYHKQVAYFKNDYRCICFDFRGQGKSEVTDNGYDMDTLANDAIALIRKLDIKKCHFVGLSMGGFVGQRVAIKNPELLDSLILLETSADPEDPEKVQKYNKLIMAIKWLGMKMVSKKIMPIMFGQTFLADKSRKAEYKQWKANLEQNNKKGIVRATRGVIDRQGVHEQINCIRTPTLVMVGDEDVATPYQKAERIHLAIEGSKLVVIEKAGHTSTIEEPKQVNQAVEQFLQSLKV
ncbi:MAG: alpha/beta hydrolase [Gammaproteobacteria bacterium]|nr:MAG: alpha/beta hydrolase [Gammaproteobacteria bacterium]